MVGGCGAVWRTLLEDLSVWSERRRHWRQEEEEEVKEDRIDRRRRTYCLAVQQAAWTRLPTPNNLTSTNVVVVVLENSTSTALKYINANPP